MYPGLVQRGQQSAGEGRDPVYFDVVRVARGQSVGVTIKLQQASKRCARTENIEVHDSASCIK